MVTASSARYEATVRPFAEMNKALAPGPLKGMVLGSPAQIWMQTRMVGVRPHLPGGRRILRRVAEGIHRAATAITLDDGPRPCAEA